MAVCLNAGATTSMRGTSQERHRLAIHVPWLFWLHTL